MDFQERIDRHSLPYVVGDQSKLNGNFLHPYTLSMKKTSPYLRTEELEELVSIADQLLYLTSPKEVSEQTARLAEIQHTKKHRSTELRC